MDERQWKVGELAAQTGLTVRTLHHWDELGLLAPSRRSGAGYRLYGPADVERLYRIVALRRDQLGPEGMEKGQRDRADPRVQELVARWNALIEQFTGGDPGIRSSLERMYREEGAEGASRGMVKPELMEYMGRAMGDGRN